ncbi:hypothetical protein ACJIZ3_006485 [Penstemon smallii]|uniref:Uncharacterized protein n=1 Tax=Penstemon smallii TaxID=265156 RepID=A0ABD3S7V5_9LAMI
MDSAPSKKDLAKSEARRRYASRSLEQKEDLSRRSRSAYASRVALCSLLPDDVTADSSLAHYPTAPVGMCCISLVSSSPAFNLLFPFLFLIIAAPLDCDVHMSAAFRPINPSSLSFAFEAGQSSGGSLDVQHDLSPPLIQRCKRGRPPRVVDRFARLRDVPNVPWILPAVGPCIHCGARRFFRGGSSFCCSNGQICLPKNAVCAILHFLFTNLSEVACEFRRQARTYNNAFAFTSIGMSTDSESWWAKDGKYALKVFGQVFHYMNPDTGSPNSADLL